MKIRPVGTEYDPCGHTDGRAGGQTDEHDKANSYFS